MVVPDFELICEIMLVAEGFLDARLLARKFITLYTLCKELLSKQVRGQPGRPEFRGPAHSTLAWQSPARPPGPQTPSGQGTAGPRALTRHPPRRITTTGACGPSSPCWWWLAPSSGATPAARRTRCSCGR